MSDHEPLWEIPDGEETELAYVGGWRFSPWAIAGIMTGNFGDAVQAIGRGFVAIAREFDAMAEWRRNRFDYKEAQREELARQRAFASLMREAQK